MLTLSQRNVFIPFLCLLMALSWLTLWVWGQSPYGRFLSHEGLRLSEVRAGFGVLLLLGGWTVMLVAMMLPTSLPLIGIFYRMTRQRADRALLVWLLLAGYLLVWTLFGLVAVLGDSVLHETVEGHVWLETHAWFIGAGIFMLAGIYQFTPLKYYCLDKCRTPLSFVMTHWQGRRDRWHAFRLGLRHGLFCLGCCWSLMLLMFAVGMSNLGWMFLLGAVMAIEKNAPWGRRFSAPLGGLLLCCGLAIVLQATLMTFGNAP
jgi:predicted metal-binding membrane protein